MHAIRLKALQFDEALESASDLAAAVRLSGYLPDFVLAVATGGLLPGFVVSRALGCPMLVIRLARPMTSLKRYLPLRILPPQVRASLRNLEMSLGVYRRLGRRSISEVSTACRPGNYLVVDDSLDTGRTMAVVVTYLGQHGVRREHVRIAVLTQIFDDATPPADYKLYERTNITFPWSMDSPEHPRFLAFAREHLPPISERLASVLPVSGSPNDGGPRAC